MITSVVQKTRESSSFFTIFSVVNTTIGSGCLVLPVIFNDCGVITCLIILFVVAVISVKTCELVVMHVKESEEDLPILIQRLLGKKWSYAYCLSSSFMLFLVVIIYYLLLTNLIYLIISFIILRSGSENFASSDNMDWSRFSFQYASIITLILTFLLLNLRKIAFLVKLGHYGVICLYIYTIFIIYLAAANLADGTYYAHTNDIKLVTGDIGNLAGTFALAFNIHNCVIPIMKQNKFQENNVRDIKIAFSISTCVYVIIGVFGMIGVVGKSGGQINTVMDYFTKDDPLAFCIEVVFSLHLCTSLPILAYLSRTQFMQLFYNYDKIPTSWSFLFNVITAVVCVIFGIFNVSPTVVISITGAVVGFLLIYIIPIFLHMKCLYFRKKKGNDFMKPILEVAIDEKNELRMEIESKPMSLSQMEKPLLNNTSACEHPVNLSIPFWVRAILYSIALAIGFAFLIIQIVYFVLAYQ